MKHLVHIALLVAVTGCSSTTESTAAKPSDNAQKVTTTQVNKEKPKEQLICKTEKKLGSNHRTRICRPKDNAHDTSIRNTELMNSLGAGR
jgi:uncharacterized protein YceK